MKRDFIQKGYCDQHCRYLELRFPASLKIGQALFYGPCKLFTNLSEKEIFIRSFLHHSVPDEFYELALKSKSRHPLVGHDHVTWCLDMWDPPRSLFTRIAPSTCTTFPRVLDPNPVDPHQKHLREPTRDATAIVPVVSLYYLAPNPPFHISVRPHLSKVASVSPDITPKSAVLELLMLIGETTTTEKAITLANALRVSGSSSLVPANSTIRAAIQDTMNSAQIPVFSNSVSTFANHHSVSFINSTGVSRENTVSLTCISASTSEEARKLVFSVLPHPVVAELRFRVKKGDWNAKLGFNTIEDRLSYSRAGKEAHTSWRFFTPRHDLRQEAHLCSLPDLLKYLLESAPGLKKVDKPIQLFLIVWLDGVLNQTVFSVRLFDPSFTLFPSGLSQILPLIVYNGPETDVKRWAVHIITQIRKAVDMKYVSATTSVSYTITFGYVCGDHHAMNLMCGIRGWSNPLRDPLSKTWIPLLSQIFLHSTDFLDLYHNRLDLPRNEVSHGTRACIIVTHKYDDNGLIFMDEAGEWYPEHVISEVCIDTYWESLVRVPKEGLVRDIDLEHYFELEEIITHKQTSLGRLYLVKWSEYNNHCDITWTHASDFSDTRVIDTYESTLPARYRESKRVVQHGSVQPATSTRGGKCEAPSKSDSEPSEEVSIVSPARKSRCQRRPSTAKSDRKQGSI